MINSLVKNSIKSKKKSYILLIITIILTAAMMLSVILIVKGETQKFINENKDIAQVYVEGITESQREKLKNDNNISWIGETIPLGYSSQGKIILSVAYADKNYLLNHEGIDYTGEFPENEDEILLPEQYLKELNVNYKTGDKISLDIKGNGEIKDYKIKGIYDDTNAKKSNDCRIIVSRKECVEILGEKEPYILGYIRLNTQEINENYLIEEAENILKNYQIEDIVKASNYSRIMTGKDSPVPALPIKDVVIVVTILAIIVIKGIFSTMVNKEVKTIGQLRTIGMSKKQVRKFIKKETKMFTLVGITGGDILGVIIALVIVPKGFVIVTTLKAVAVVSFIVWLIIKIATMSPVLKASKISPIEGMRFSGYNGIGNKDRRAKKSLNVFNLAFINIGRNKLKAAFNILMMSLSLTSLIACMIVSESIDAKQRARFFNFPYGDIQISINGSNSTFTDNLASIPEKQIKNNPLSNEEFLKKINNINGVEKIIKSNAVYYSHFYNSPDGQISGGASYLPVLTREDFNKIKPYIIEGETDYDELVKGDKIIADSRWLPLGAIMNITGVDKEGNEVTKELEIAGLYDFKEIMEKSPVTPSPQDFFLTYDFVYNFSGIKDQTGVLSIKTDENKFGEVKNYIKDIANTEDDYYEKDIEETTSSIKNYYEDRINMFKFIAIAVLTLGTLSFLNTLLVDYQSRERENGLLRVMGMTQKQISNMLSTEVFAYIGISAVIGVILGSISGKIVCYWLQKEDHCINFSYPWYVIIVIIAILLIIYIITAIVFKKSTKNMEVMSAIRNE